MSEGRPEELRQVVWNTWIIGSAFIIGSIAQVALLNQASQLGQLILGTLSIPVVLMLQRARGILSWMLAFIVFAVYTVFGLVLFVYGFLPFLFSLFSVSPQTTLSLVSGAIIYFPPFLAFTLGCVNFFRILTSESLNGYLGTEAIFPVTRRPTGGSPAAKPPEEREIEPARPPSTEQVASELNEAKMWLDSGDYSLAIKHSSEAVRATMIEKLNLEKSLTNDEILDRLKGHGHDIDIEGVKYVFLAGEECTYAARKPNKDEAEKVLKISDNIIATLRVSE